jgi:hypothetical protein
MPKRLGDLIKKIQRPNAFGGKADIDQPSLIDLDL